MKATVTAPPIELDGELLLHQAAQQANASHLHLVIDRHGNTLLTPIMLPGMVKIPIRDKSLAKEAA